VRIRVLGTIGVERTLGGVDVLAGAKPRSLLALLASRAGTVVSEATVEDALWGDRPPPSARTALQTYVSAVRSFLEPDRPARAPGSFVATEADGYALRVGTDALDVALFEHRVAGALACRSTDPDQAAAWVDEAVQLWAPPLPGLADADWARPFVQRVVDLHQRCLELRFGLALAAGQHDAIVDPLRAAVDAHPYAERLTGALMLALYRSGRQADALAVYRRTRRRLADDLGLDPARELQLLERQMLLQDPRLSFADANRPGVPSDRWPEAAPPASAGAVAEAARTFVGRRAELAALAEHVVAHRLVTLTGPGGVGKSRLVRQLLARGVASETPTVVDLAALRDDAEVTRSVAAALGLVEHPYVPLAEQIVDALEADARLVVLDTCEHVLNGAGAVARLLLRTAAVRVLAVSRRPLGVGGEIVVPLAPLSLPEPETADPLASEAVQLLRERLGEVGATQPSDVLAALCRRLDGLPLAIELAAPLLRSVDPAVLVARLPDAHRLLRGDADGPPRHRSLEAAIRWSVELLGPAERAALEAAVTFAGPFRLEAAERLFPELGVEQREVLGGLAHLAECSLLFASTDAGGAGYRVLDTVRAFVRDEMAAAGRLDGALDAHAAWVGEVVREAARSDRRGLRPDLPVEDLADEISAALDRLERTASGSPEHVALAGSLSFFWNHTGRLAEGRQRLGRVLDADRTGEPIARSLVLAGEGFLAWYQGDFADVDRRLSEALQLLEPLAVGSFFDLLTAGRAFVRGELDNAEEHIALALATTPDRGRDRLVALDMGANIAWFRCAYATGIDRFREQGAIAERIGDRFVLAQARRGEGVLQACDGDLELGWALCAQSLRIAEERRDDLSIAQSHAACAVVAMLAGESADARQRAVEAIGGSVRQFDTFALLVALPVLAGVEAAAERHGAVAAIGGWFRALCEATGVFPPPHAAELLAEATGAARACLGSGPYARQCAVGAQARLRELLDLVGAATHVT
jgi:predicted ATPase/DNA-binding SARP family transcriptional activator